MRNRGLGRLSNVPKTSPRKKVAEPEYKLGQSDSHALDLNLGAIWEKELLENGDRRSQGHKSLRVRSGNCTPIV